MAAVTVRILPYERADGAANMAADEALLDAAAAGMASLRFYGWAEPTVSLGYFQPAAVRLESPRLAELPFVRRPSGGATLVHHFELTYALALPADRASSDVPWLCRMHRLLAAALARLGVQATACAAAAPGEPSGILCFRRWTPGDLVAGGSKVVGSAQRRYRGALLQHGAVLLAQSPYTPELPGIAELTGRSIAAADLAAALQAELQGETGWRLESRNWLEMENQRRRELEEARYRQPAWNLKR